MTPPDLQARITAMSDTELVDHLCTCDGRGTTSKRAALEELIDRAIQATLREVRGEP